MVNRTLLATIGAWGVAALLAGVLARCWPAPSVDAATLAMLAAPIVAAATAVASFAVRRTSAVAVAIGLASLLAAAVLA